MEIDLNTVCRVFHDVLDGRMTREAADRWAYDLLQQSEVDSLTYSPAAEEERIWNSIMYIYGIDIMESPGKYLHSDENIRDAMRYILGMDCE